MDQKTNSVIITRLSERTKQFSSADSNDVSILPAISYLYTIPTGFHNLPIKYLVRTFRYLSSYDLEKNVMPVCSHWRYAAYRPELWTHLRITRGQIPREYVMNRLRNFTEIKHLHLENFQDLNAVLSQACRCLKKLKGLKVRKCAKLSNSSLNYILRTHENLELIDVSKTSLESRYMFPKFGQFKKLKSLNLSHVPNLTIKNLMEAVVNCHFLEELKISNIKMPKVYLTDEDAGFIISKISETLKSLSIDCSSLTNIFFNTLFDCNKLTRLCLYGARNITGDILQDLWHYLPKLKEFKLRHAHHITSSDIEALFSDNAKKHIVRQLTLLDLTGCWKLNDKAAEVIAAKCTNLKSLTLKSCKQLTDLRNLCARLQNLTYLNVAYCLQLSCAGDAVMLPPNLKEFVVHLDANTTDLIQKIREDRSDVQLYISLSEFNKSLIHYRG